VKFSTLKQIKFLRRLTLWGWRHSSIVCTEDH